MNALFVDNFDSFSYNVVHLLGGRSAAIDVLLADDERLTPRRLDGCDALVVGPGPGRPSSYPQMLGVLDAALERRLPVLGICLGLQAIAHVLGGTIVRAPFVMHGKTSAISHDGTGLFRDLPNPLTATRYHSLCVEERSLPDRLRVTAHSEDGVVQGIQDRELPVFGLQFHPESVLSECGDRIAANFFGAAVRAR